MRPIIGIFGFPLNMDNKPFSALGTTYTDAVVAGGGLPLILPVFSSKEEMEELLTLCDGVIVPGGADIDPAFYQEEPSPEVTFYQTEFDQLEFDALTWLQEHHVPVFGICRGCQVMNVFDGGTLYQDLPSQYPGPVGSHNQTALSIARSTPTHRVNIEADSRLARLLGTEVMSNSMHHQSVLLPGPHYRVTARTEDGVVEAIEHENGSWFAVQWHPECLIETVPVMKELFRSFVADCITYHNKK